MTLSKVDEPHTSYADQVIFSSFLNLNWNQLLYREVLGTMASLSQLVIGVIDLGVLGSVFLFISRGRTTAIPFG